MADFATSDSPIVQAQLDRLNAMTAGQDKLGRARLRRLLKRLGNPERQMPPAFHVSGTNGKGSTCTYLRGAIAAAGLTAHAYTSPHLVRLNERIRIAGRLVSDEELAKLLSDTLDAVGDDETTFFEATTAAAFLGFARHPADACIIEVGIGGRLDATNVIPSALACGITQIGIDHQRFLGDTIEEIASEKAGIAKPGVPLVTLVYPPAIAGRFAEVAASADAPVLAKGEAWDAWTEGNSLHYRDEQGELTLPAPALPGAHQADNAGLAIAMLRHQDMLRVGPDALAEALRCAKWPGRLSRLGPGPATDLLPAGAELWLDGAHNVAAMEKVAAFMQQRLRPDGKLHVVLALLEDKDAEGVLGCFTGIDCQVLTVPISGYQCRTAADLRATARNLRLEASEAMDFTEALDAIGKQSVTGEPPVVLITGSLYLAGQVLRFNRELPD